MKGMYANTMVAGVRRFAEVFRRAGTPEMLSRAIAGLLLIGSVACTEPDRGEAPDWLAGSWELTHNPTGDDEDVLIFDEQGQVTVQTEDKRRLHGRYHVKDSTLLLLLMIGNRQVETQFELDHGNQRLVYKNGAYYTKH